MNQSGRQSTISEWARDAEKEILAVKMPNSAKKKSVWFGKVSRKGNSYQSIEGNKSMLSRVKIWYIGDASLGRKRYCGRRANLCAFVCAHICILTLILLIILIPLFYLVLIPNSIQGQLSNSSLDGKNLNLSLGTNGNNFHADLDFKKILFIPGIATLIAPTELQFGEEPSVQNPFAKVVLTEINVAINQDSRLGIDGNFTLLSTPSFGSIVTIVTGSNYVVYLKTGWTIKFWGIVWYRNLPLSSQYNLQTVTGKSFFNFVTNYFLKGISTGIPVPKLF